MKSKKVTIYQLTFMAMMAAVTCILGPLSVPIGQIPISLTNLVIYFTVFVLGIWAGTGSYGIYLLLGAVGLPVFSGFAGGLGKLWTNRRISYRFHIHGTYWRSCD